MKLQMGYNPSPNKKGGGVDTSDGNLDTTKMLVGQVGYSKNKKVIGTMQDLGSLIITPILVDRPIPKGYHDGTGIVKAKTPELFSNTTAILNTSRNIIDIPFDFKVVVVTAITGGAVLCGTVLSNFSEFTTDSLSLTVQKLTSKSIALDIKAKVSGLYQYRIEAY